MNRYNIDMKKTKTIIPRVGNGLTNETVERRFAAQILGVTPQTVDRYRHQGLLKVVKMWDKGRYRYDRSEVERLARGH